MVLGQANQGQQNSGSCMDRVSNISNALPVRLRYLEQDDPLEREL